MLIYVWNLSLNVSEDNFRQTFEAFGQVSFAIISSTILKDRYSGQSRGFAFVEMDSQANAQKAISMFNDYTLNERQIAVSFARPREERGGFEQRNRNQKRGGGQRRY